MSLAPEMASVRRHFPPATSRTRFSPERLLAPLPHALRMVFADEAAPSSGTPFTANSTDQSFLPPASDSSLNFDNLLLIRKPPGEAGRSGGGGRNGYNLQDALGWDDSFYQDVKVRTSWLRGRNLTPLTVRNISWMWPANTSMFISRSPTKVQPSWQLCTQRYEEQFE